MKAHLLVGDVSEPPLEVRGAGFEILGLHRPSPDHPERNEDAGGLWLAGEDSVVLAVADGMGGTPAGHRAARLGIEELDRALANAAADASLRPAILDAIERANARVLDETPGSGSTLLVAECGPDGVRIYHVGDSEAMLVGQRGRVKLETTSHSPVGYGVAAGLLDSDEALVHDDRHFLSNHLGARDMHVEIASPQPWARHDTLLLASDGLFDNAAQAEIVESIRCGPLPGCLDRLASLARTRMAGGDPRLPGKSDDLTIWLARRRPSS